MEKLTPSQEDMIYDMPYHEKKLKEGAEKNKRKFKAFPVSFEKLDRILKKIGRRKL